MQTNRKTIFLLVGMFLGLFVGAVFYWNLWPSMTFNEKVVDTKVNTQVSGENHKQIGTAPLVKEQFSVVRASDTYSALHAEYILLNSTAAKIDYDSLRLAREKVLKDSLNFGFDIKNNQQERAYALNIFNQVYLGGYNGEYFNGLILANQFLKQEYDRNYKYISSFKRSGIETVNGVMYNQNTPEKNFALQRTLMLVNQTSYDLYPTSYALLRRMLNFVQSNTVLGLNFKLDNKYPSKEAFIQSKYYDGFIEYYDGEIARLKLENKLYENLAVSRYEIDTMMTEYLFTKMDRYPKLGRAEKKELAEEIIQSARNMVIHSDEYNTERQLFFGYVFAAGNMVRVANMNLLELKEKEDLLLEAEGVLEKLFRNNKNPNLDSWLTQLSPKLETSKAIKQLSERNKYIANYLTYIKK